MEQGGSAAGWHPRRAPLLGGGCCFGVLARMLAGAADRGPAPCERHLGAAVPAHTAASGTRALPGVPENDEGTRFVRRTCRGSTRDRMSGEIGCHRAVFAANCRTWRRRSRPVRSAMVAARGGLRGGARERRRCHLQSRSRRGWWRPLRPDRAESHRPSHSPILKHHQGPEHMAVVLLLARVFPLEPFHGVDPEDALSPQPIRSKQFVQQGAKFLVEPMLHRDTETLLAAVDARPGGLEGRQPVHKYPGSTTPHL